MISTAVRTIHNGFYTIILENGKHYTFRVTTNGADSSFAPGKQVMAFLHNGCEYTSFAFINGPYVNPWKRFQSGYGLLIAAARYLVNGNHEQAGKMYALESGCCYVCNRLLTDPLSVELGIGPTCRSRM